MEFKYFNELVELFENMDDCDKISMHNNYCDAINDTDSQIFEMWDFDDIMFGQSASNIASMVCNGEFDTSDEYFTFNGYGNLMSFDYWNIDSHIEFDDIAHYCLDNDCDFDEKDIRAILDRYAEELEKEETEKAIEERYKAECDFDKRFDACQWGGVVC